MTASQWHSDFNLPIPPVDMVYNETVGFWAATVYLCVASPIVLYMLWHLRERRGQIMLLIMIGGTLCSLVEPFADVLGACWHPEVGQPTAFTLLGRSIPWWVVIGYFTYFGAIASWNFLAYSRGITRRLIWIAFLVPIAGDIFMENLMLHYGLYAYYGNQPLDFLGYLPLWWPPINALGVFGGVVALFLLMPHLKGWRVLLIPLILPTVDLVVYGILAYPAVIVVNIEGLSPVVTHLAGLYSWVMALVCVHMATYLLASNSPLRRKDGLVLPLPHLWMGTRLPDAAASRSV